MKEEKDFASEREFFGLSQDELAGYFGVTRGFIAQIENEIRQIPTHLFALYRRISMLYIEHYDHPVPDPFHPKEQKHVVLLIKKRKDRVHKLKKSIWNLERKVPALTQALRTQQLKAILIKDFENGTELEATVAKGWDSNHYKTAQTVNEATLYEAALKLKLLKQELEVEEGELGRLELGV